MTTVLIALSIVAILLFIVYVRGRAKRSSQEDSQRSSKADKFDTTLGELHDMREALRPLEHTRAASRRDPQQRG